MKYTVSNERKETVIIVKSHSEYISLSRVPVTHHLHLCAVSNGRKERVMIVQKSADRETLSRVPETYLLHSCGVQSVMKQKKEPELLLKQF